jgi:hypothetical protein
MRATERNRDPGAELRELKSPVDLTGRKSQTAKKNGAEPFGHEQENEEAHSCFSYTERKQKLDSTPAAERN